MHVFALGIWMLCIKTRNGNVRAWSRPLSLWWWHVLLSVTCDHTSSAVHSWLDVFTVILYPRKYGPVTSRLGGDSAPTASIPGSATQLMSLGQDSHRLHWFSCELYSSIWVRDSSVTVVQCSLHVLILQRCPVDRCHWSIGSQQGLCAKTDCRVGT